MGQGLVLAMGQILGNPWIGVVLSVAALPALCYWMLREWVAPEWALAGGFLAALEFGPLSPWMNTYWGGAVSGIAGCPVFGAIPRIAKGRRRDPILLGAGLGMQMLSRPYEFVLLLLIVGIFWLPRRALAITALAWLPAAGLTLLQNKQVTGHWTELPYVLSRYQYGIPTTFTIQPVPVPHQPLTVEQQIDYDAQAETHGKNPETIWTFMARLGRACALLSFLFPRPALSCAALLPSVSARSPFRPRYGRHRGFLDWHDILSVFLSALHRGGHLPVRARQRQRPRATQPSENSREWMLAKMPLA